jgi:uncharacterized SAM-binding protein YcdF (DUF218 family)
MPASPPSFAGRSRETARVKLRRWTTRLLATIGLITVLVVFTPVVSWWARAYSGPIERPEGDTLILLSAANDDLGTISYSSYWRARFAVIAWQSGSFKRIVISGGAGPGISNFLAANGIPRTVMSAEWKSTSTRENAIETSRLLNGMPGRKVLLTSDFHMFRAIRVFRKLGIDVTPMPVPDAIQSEGNAFARFSAFQNMVIESVKIVYYELRGWI